MSYIAITSENKFSSVISLLSMLSPEEPQNASGISLNTFLYFWLCAIVKMLKLSVGLK